MTDHSADTVTPSRRILPLILAAVIPFALVAGATLAYVLLRPTTPAITAVPAATSTPTPTPTGTPTPSPTTPSPTTPTTTLLPRPAACDPFLAVATNPNADYNTRLDAISTAMTSTDNPTLVLALNNYLDAELATVTGDTATLTVDEALTAIQNYCDVPTS